MKKIVLIGLLLIAVVPQLMAQRGYGYGYDNRPMYNPGALRVSLADNYPITVAVDGRYFNRHGSYLTVNGLPPGRHHLKVYEYTPSEDGRADAHLVYEGKVNIFENNMTSFVMDVNTGQVDIRRDDLNNNPDNAPQANADNNMNDNGGNGNTPPPPAPPVYDNGGGVGTPPMEPAYTQPTFPKITKAAVDALGVKVNAKVTDMDKMALVKAALKKKAVNTNQLSLMMAWFNFESSRVELLQFAYDHTTDKQNYRRLKDQLTYEGSKQDLDNVINSNK